MAKPRAMRKRAASMGVDCDELAVFVPDNCFNFLHSAAAAEHAEQ